VERKLNISIGLPGSGKTTKFKELSKEAGRNSNHIECDYYLRITRSYEGSMEKLLRDRSSIFHHDTFLDGLFLTKEDVKKVINAADNRGNKPTHVVIHYWNENREYCNWNDKGRREADSNITIDNAKMDSLKEIMTLREDFPKIKFFKKVYDVEKKPRWKVWADINELYINDEGILKGSSWSLGGSWNDCWGNTGSISPETPPEGMSELDDLLEKVSPSITFLQYKKIMNECVSVHEYSDHDYYGGCTYHNQYQLNVSCLYNYLVDKGLLDEV